MINHWNRQHIVLCIKASAINPQCALCRKNRKRRYLTLQWSGCRWRHAVHPGIQTRWMSVTRPNSEDREELMVPLPCSELAAKRAFTKDDIWQVSTGTFAGKEGGNLQRDWLQNRAWRHESRHPAAASSHICRRRGWHLRRSADRRAYSGHRWTRTAVKDRSASRAGGSGNNSHLGTDT